MALSLETEICEQLGIEYPVFAFNHCRDVIAAVSNGGGIGVMGATGLSPEGILAEGNWLRKHTGKPFGMDILLPAKVPVKAAHEELLSSIPKENIEFMKNGRNQ